MYSCQLNIMPCVSLASVAYLIILSANIFGSDAPNFLPFLLLLHLTITLCLDSV